MGLKEAEQRIIVALDGLSLHQCREILRNIGPRVYAYKIHDLWDREGAGVVRLITGADRIFVDLKLKDNPHTVALRARAVRDAGAGILTVDASGGVEMMRAAVENGPPRIFAVTVLTSLDESACNRIHGRPVIPTVMTLARLAKEAGVHGIVCSPQEVNLLASDPDFKDMEIVAVGIRPREEVASDHKRFGTPAAAIKAGATRLVIGRPITAASSPGAAFDAIVTEIALAMDERR